MAEATKMQRSESRGVLGLEKRSEIWTREVDVESERLGRLG